MALSVLVRKICKVGIRFHSCSIEINDVYVISAARTPFGVFQGKLAPLTGVELGTRALVGAIEKSGFCKEDIQELVVGCVCETGMGQGPAHQIARYADLQHSTITWSFNKLCSSGMKAIMLGSQLLYNQAQEVVACGGMESLTHAPYILRRKALRLGNIVLADLILHDMLNDAIQQIDVTIYAEQTAREFQYTREELDDYALQSYAKTAQATEAGNFKDEIVPVCIKGRGGVEEVITEDEEFKRLNPEKLRKMAPYSEVGVLENTRKEGSITLGNSSGLNDGAAMVILASGNYVLKKDIKPLARIVSFADAHLPANKFCLTPSVAIPRALLRANLTIDKIAVWEISETFALTALVNAKILKIPHEKLNIHGGAVSLGHPFGATGARLIGHLAYTLKPGEFGCASVSQATGGGCAMIIEKM